MLILWNTLTNQKEPFTSLEKKRVNMYNCGPTVYHFAHIGNLRSYIFADTLKRALILNGYKVRQVINITDVGHLVGDSENGRDKMEEGTKREGKTAAEISALYTRAFLNDLEKLNINTDGTIFPKATEHINEQIDLIKTLEKKGFAYKTSEGICFDTGKFKDYGKLGKIDLAHLKAGARVTINSEKKHITDFMLWRFSQPHEKREQEWQSPWGVGFPGWHIECSAMAMKYLGETLDIHTGGIDHIPVHHNNEIAQSESATDKQYVRFWLHNEFVNTLGEKMAKSENNFLTLNSIIERGVWPTSYRYWLLTAHYRSPVQFTWGALDGAHSALIRLTRSYSDLPTGGKVDKNYQEQFEKFINDDLDTPKVLALVWELLKDKSVTAENKRATLNEFDSVLGLNLRGSAALLKKIDKDIPPAVKKIIKERETAREQKNWKKADELREEARKAGFDIKDTEKGQKTVKL